MKTHLENLYKQDPEIFWLYFTFHYGNLCGDLYEIKNVEADVPESLISRREFNREMVSMFYEIAVIDEIMIHSEEVDKNLAMILDRYDEIIDDLRETLTKYFE